MKVKAIFGPPGTGKTQSLINHAKAFAGRPSLFLSFTRSAAAEAVARLPDNDYCRASTIHSMAFNALNMSRSGVVDKKKLDQFSKETGFPFKGSEEGSEDPQEGDDYLQVISFARNRMCTADVAYDRFNRPGVFARFTKFIGEYDAWKKTYGYFDFDDMLYQYLNSKHVKNAHTALLLDEAQDCSPLQWAVMERLIGGCSHVVIAGDDDQAIYEWNGAHPHGMIEFINQNGGTYEVLERSFRVPKVVHELAQSIILKIKQRVPKIYTPAPKQGLITHYGDIWNVNLTEFANGGGGMILVRDRWRMDEVKRTLNRDMLPYDVIGGGSPWTSKIAKELRAGGKPMIPSRWVEFYRQADLTLPIDIIVSTIHQAKGREHDKVLIDLTVSAKTLIEYEKDPDAETRVQYVAVTRAKSELILCGSNPLI